MEIERKYAIKHIPNDIETYHKKVIEQGYLCHNPIVRIRKSNEEYYLTYKSKMGLCERKIGGPLINHEVELPLTPEAYETLRGKTENHIIYKTRYHIPLPNERIAELDIFEGHLHGLQMVEVEFDSEEEANEFTPPDWFGIELTEDRRFSNYHLSKLTGYNELGLKE